MAIAIGSRSRSIAGRLMLVSALVVALSLAFTGAASARTVLLANVAGTGTPRGCSNRADSLWDSQYCRSRHSELELVRHRGHAGSDVVRHHLHGHRGLHARQRREHTRVEREWLHLCAQQGRYRVLRGGPHGARASQLPPRHMDRRYGRLDRAVRRARRIRHERSTERRGPGFPGATAARSARPGSTATRRLKTTSKRPARMNRHGALEFRPHRLPWSSSSARLAGDCQRRVRHRDQHLNGAASLVEADPAEVSQTALGEVVVCAAGVRGAVGGMAGPPG